MKGLTIKNVNTLAPKIPMSVVLIALNEESNIARALNSVSWADEVLIFDSGSTDKTVEIAKKLGANVVVGEWLGYGPTKNKAAGLARHDWVLSVDCDEEVTAELQNEIRSGFEMFNPESVYRVPRISFYLGRWIRHGGWYPDRQARLFNRKKHNWNAALIHEKVEAASYVNLASNLNHYVFKNIEKQVAANNHYSGLQASEMKNQGKAFSWFHFFTKPSVKFLECYFLKLGFLDGWPGYVIARNAAYSVFLKWSKVRELEMEAK